MVPLYEPSSSSSFLYCYLKIHLLFSLSLRITGRGVWTWVCMTVSKDFWQTSTVTFYVNGQMCGSAKMNTNCNMQQPQAQVGGFPGQIANVAFFKQALTEDEVFELWKVSRQPYPALCAPPLYPCSHRKNLPLALFLKLWMYFDARIVTSVDNANKQRFKGEGPDMVALNGAEDGNSIVKEPGKWEFITAFLVRAMAVNTTLVQDSCASLGGPNVFLPLLMAPHFLKPKLTSGNTDDEEEEEERKTSTAQALEDGKTTSDTSNNDTTTATAVASSPPASPNMINNNSKKQKRKNGVKPYAAPVAVLPPNLTVPDAGPLTHVIIVETMAAMIRGSNANCWLLQGGLLASSFRTCSSVEELTEIIFRTLFC